MSDYRKRLNDEEEFYRLGKKAGIKQGTGAVILSGDEYEITDPNDDGGIVVSKREEVEDVGD